MRPVYAYGIIIAMKTLTARARALAAPKETLDLSPREADRLEKRIGPRPSQLTPLGLCLERALANMHVEYAARQVELIQGTFPAGARSPEVPRPSNLPPLAPSR